MIALLMREWDRVAENLRWGSERADAPNVLLTTVGVASQGMVNWRTHGQVASGG